MPSTTRKRWAVSGAVGLCFLIACATAQACLWDRDTLAAELRGLPDVAEIIVGRFERNPPRFYDMRLERVRAHLQREAQDLAAYDDAAVAADRLHRGDDAIAWMAQKRQQLDRRAKTDPQRVEHEYRYLANLGTFHAHRWLRSGASRDRLDDLKQARDFIAAAIKLNPEAHFGRERYQLMAIEWLLEPPPLDRGALADSLFWTARERVGGEEVALGRAPNRQLLEQASLGDAVKGLTGLIVLGDAWQSADIFYALAIALSDSRQGSLAYLAGHRVRELLQEADARGVPGSLHPELAGSLRARLDDVEQGNHAKSVPGYFAQARQAAAEWHAAREKFMLARFDQGRHPDTDADFWQGFEDVPLPRPDAFVARNPWLVPGLAIALLLAVAMEVKARRRKTPAAPAPIRRGKSILRIALALSAAASLAWVLLD